MQQVEEALAVRPQPSIATTDGSSHKRAGGSHPEQGAVAELQRVLEEERRRLVEIVIRKAALEQELETTRQALQRATLQCEERDELVALRLQVQEFRDKLRTKQAVLETMAEELLGEKIKVAQLRQLLAEKERHATPNNIMP